MQHLSTGRSRRGRAVTSCPRAGACRCTPCFCQGLKDPDFMFLWDRDWVHASKQGLANFDTLAVLSALESLPCQILQLFRGATQNLTPNCERLGAWGSNDWCPCKCFRSAMRSHRRRAVTRKEFICSFEVPSFCRSSAFRGSSDAGSHAVFKLRSPISPLLQRI